MHPPHRPRDIIDAIDAIAARDGNFASIDADYYEDFIALSQAEIEKLAVAIMLDHDREVRRLASSPPRDQADVRVAKFIHNTFAIMATGLVRFDVFGRLTFVSQTGPSAYEVDFDEELAARLTALEPIVLNQVRRSLPWLLSREMSQGELGL